MKRVNGRRKENGTEEMPVGEKEEAEERRDMGNGGEVALTDDGPFFDHDGQGKLQATIFCAIGVQVVIWLALSHISELRS